MLEDPENSPTPTASTSTSSRRTTTKTNIKKETTRMDHHHRHTADDDDDRDSDVKPNTSHPGTPGLVDDKRNVTTSVKPGRVLNRVPRACNACRKQKMRCEGAENPPCRRCRHAGLECLFEKPSREASLTGEAGLERIRSLESSVEELKGGQRRIEKSIDNLVAALQSSSRLSSGSGSYAPQQQNPGGGGGQYYSLSSNTSPAVSAATPSSTGTSQPMDGMISHPLSTTSSESTLPPIMTPPPNGSSNFYTQRSMLPVPGRPPTRESYHHQPYTSGAPTPVNGVPYAPTHTLPPISALPGINDSASRYPPQTQYGTSAGAGATTHGRRPGRSNRNSNSNVTSTNSSSDEAEDGMGASGLVAPLEVLRGLADEAVKRASKENGEGSEPTSRQRSPEQPGRKSNRPAKRRKMDHAAATPQDVVSKGKISETTARQLFQIFYDGCSTFLPVFDGTADGFDALHPNSPFAVDAICMVGARMMKGGGQSSELFKLILEEVHQLCSSTLFQPKSSQEQVQAMVLVSGWSDNGWLGVGHAVRMALELSMNKAWPKIKKRMNTGKITVSELDHALMVSTRTWFTLYLMEHQMSYGTGRPAILTNDESIMECHRILDHPLHIEDDMRLVSTVELMTIREGCQNAVGGAESQVTAHTFDVVIEYAEKFREWYVEWDRRFEEKYPDREGSFYRQSLEIQYLVAELFHNASALRNIKSADDTQKIPANQWMVIRKSIVVATKYMEICLGGARYRENLQNAVHYTHATAAFVGAILIRLWKLFPSECNGDQIYNDISQLADVLCGIRSAYRYGLTLRIQLNGRPQPAQHRQPGLAPLQTQVSSARDQPPGYEPGQLSAGGTHIIGFHPPMQTTSPPLGQAIPAYATTAAQMPMNANAMMYGNQPMMEGIDLQQLWSAYENNNVVPMWLSNEALGDQQNVSSFGMESFMMPVDYGAPTGVVGGANWQ